MHASQIYAEALSIYLISTVGSGWDDREVPQGHSNFVGVHVPPQLSSMAWQVSSIRPRGPQSNKPQ